MAVRDYLDARKERPVPVPVPVPAITAQAVSAEPAGDTTAGPRVVESMLKVGRDDPCPCGSGPAVTVHGCTAAGSAVGTSQALGSVTGDAICGGRLFLRPGVGGITIAGGLNDTQSIEGAQIVPSDISHNESYVMARKAVGPVLAAPTVRTHRMDPRMKKDRHLAGPWSGFYFKGADGALVTPEGRELHPEHLRWLSLTCQIAQEWRRLMDEEKTATRADAELQSRLTNVTVLRDRIRWRRARAFRRPC